MIRYLLDEHMPRAVAVGLMQRGVEATLAVDLGLIGKSDPELLAFAQQADYVFVTNDDDFLRLANRAPSHAGIVYSSQRRRSIGETIRFLHLLAHCAEVDAMQNKIEYF